MPVRNINNKANRSIHKITQHYNYDNGTSTGRSRTFSFGPNAGSVARWSSAGIAVPEDLQSVWNRWKKKRESPLSYVPHLGRAGYFTRSPRVIHTIAGLSDSLTCFVFGFWFVVPPWFRLSECRTDFFRQGKFRIKIDADLNRACAFDFRIN